MSLFSTEAMASYMNVESGTRKRFKPDASSQEDKDDDHEEAPKDLKESLGRLGVAHLDLLLLHRDDPAVPLKEARRGERVWK